MGRWTRFTNQERENMIDEWDRVDRDGRKGMADRLHISYLTLSVYISNWKRQKEVRQRIAAEQKAEAGVL